MTKLCYLKATIMFLAGFTAGWFGSKKILKDKYEQIAMDEMTAYRKYILDQVEGGEIVNSEDIPDNVTLMSDKVSNEDIHDKTEYHVIAGGYSDELNKLKSDKIGLSPYVITKKEYVEGRQDFTKETLQYYKQDQILVDCEDMILSNKDYLVGDLVLSDFDLSDDIDVIWVRNETITTDYIIHGLNESYEEAMMGPQDE